MELVAKNLGPLEEATWNLGKLNILAGPNGSGKTYFAHALHAALHPAPGSFPTNQRNSVIGKIADTIYETGSATIAVSDLEEFFVNSHEFATQRNTFKFRNYMTSSGAPEPTVMWNMGGPDLVALAEQRLRDGVTFAADWLHVEALPSNPHSLIISAELPAYLTGPLQIRPLLIRALMRNLYDLASPLTTLPYILTSERVGLYTFQPDIDFGRSEMIEDLRTNDIESRHDFSSSPWSPAVEANLDQYRSLRRQPHVGSLSPEAQRMLNLIEDMSSGEFSYQDGRYVFKPSESEVALPMASTSSTARSLFELAEFIKRGFFTGRWLVIDEPELNLHPDNQVLMGRLLALLVEAGVNVFVTTHSDYLLRELSILISLNGKDRDRWPCEYKNLGSLRADDVKVGYTVLKNGKADLKFAEVSPVTGIDTPFFNSTITRQNDFFDEVIWDE